MRHVLFFVLLTLTTVWMTACASGPRLQRVVSHEKGILIVLDKSPITSSPAFDAPYSHPAKITTIELQRILEAIRIAPKQGMLMSMFTTRKVESLFAKETAARLSIKFSHVLAEAAPSERVRFYQTRPLSLSKVSVTSGFFLVKEGRIHFKLNHYKVPLKKGHHPASAGLGLKPSEKGKLVFELFEGERITHRTYKNMIGLEATDPHWLVIDYAGFPEMPETAETSERPAFRAPVQTETLEERLRILKRFREEGLITEEEYSEKKRSLLKDF